MHSTTLESAYAYCQQRASSHYENFPVASLLLPKAIRRPVSVIYTFARQADDLADEGELTAEQRISRLNQYDDLLKQIAQDKTPDDPLFVALSDVITQYRLPIQLFHDLLTAFKMDVTTKRYATFSDVLAYCRYSANPVGRLLLHLTGNDSEQNLQDSDAICSALQLINFLQDLTQDYDEMGRIYIPQEEMQRHGVTDAHFRDKINDQAMLALFHGQVDKATNLMQSGAALGWRLKGRFGLEIRMITASGLRVAHHLSQLRSNVFARPRLKKTDGLRILFTALSSRAPRHHKEHDHVAR